MGITEDLSGKTARVVGSKQVLKFAGTAQLSRVYIASDADEQLKIKIKQKCEKHDIAYDMSYTMRQIGNAAGIEVRSACAATIKQPQKDTP